MLVWQEDQYAAIASAKEQSLPLRVELTQEAIAQDRRSRCTVFTARTRVSA
ncbi:MAG: hypothetical protein HC856_07010 [Pseudanabaena sp. RU_4_16]|nr:hypothetical protein [Pseudanabaena sp. RU_4_16]